MWKEHIKYRNYCFWREGILCNEQNKEDPSELPEKCKTCGWNISVEIRRKEELRRKYEV